MLSIRNIPGFSLRADQPAIVQQVLDAFDSGKETVILQAPTGTGKSLIGRTLCTAFGSSYLLTPTKALQDQYGNDFKKTTDSALLKGKSNYICSLDHVSSVEEADCQFDRSRDQIKACQASGACPYYTARDTAMMSSCTIMNFAAYLTWRMIGEQQEEPFFGQRSFHVVDEAHKIEDSVADFLSIKISEDNLRRLLGSRRDALRVMPRAGTEEVVLDYLNSTHDLVELRLRDLAREYDCDRSSLGALAMESKEIERKVMPLLTLNDKIARVSHEGVEQYALGFSYEEPRGKLRGGPVVMAKPLYVGGFIRERVLGKRTLLMSATLPMTETWAESLGLENYAIIDVKSHFPAENRPIWFLPVGSFKKGGAERLVDPTLERIQKICAKFEKDKGIIHTPSYAYNRLLLSKLTNVGRFLICESGEDTDPLLEKHKESPEPTVLISPAMREGVDLKDHLSRFQIVVKAPFDSLGDPAIKKKMEKNPRWYNMRTLTHFLQMYGRSIRTPTDYARTYVLDQDLKEFLVKHKSALPEYVREAVRW